MENDLERNVVDVASSPGEQLKSARDAADMSELEAADHLKITVNYIRALESDDYQALPDTPYIMGYLRGYARLLALDTEALLADFHRQQGGASADEGAKVKSKDAKAGAGKFGVKQWAVVVVVLLVVWVLAVWLFAKPEADTGVDVTGTLSEPMTERALGSAPSDHLVTSVNQDVSGADEALLVTEDVEPAQMSLGNQEEKEESVEINEDQAQEIVSHDMKQSSVNSDLDRLAFVFSGECWLEITDANGDVLAADLYQKGDQFNALGKAPFQVTLGNVRETVMTLNELPYTLKPDGFRKTLKVMVE